MNFIKNRFRKINMKKKPENYINISNEVESNDIQNYELEIPKEIDAHLTIFEFFLNLLKL